MLYKMLRGSVSIQFEYPESMYRNFDVARIMVPEDQHLTVSVSAILQNLIITAGKVLFI